MIRRHKLRKVLAPTLGLGRAIAFLLLGILATFIGSMIAFNLQLREMVSQLSNGASAFLQQWFEGDQADVLTHWLGALVMFLGLIGIVQAVRMILVHIVETLNPAMKSGRVDTYLRRQQLAQGPRIVAIGGGTGLSTLLRGWKQHSSNITAIVTVTDDGGSSGRLVVEKGMIPPGDIRNCLVALADAEKAMTDLFQHRFRDDSGTLSGHSMGNLLIAALVDQARGDFETAIQIASDVLAIRGQVMPSTLDHVGLKALLDDGREIQGETAIVNAGKTIKQLKLAPENVQPFRAALDEIAEADLICIGPGSVYTSVIPNLLIPEFARAIKESPAMKVYICNVMTQPGESDSFTASEHVSAILNQVKERVFDYVVVNTGIPSQSALEKYSEYGQVLVEADTDRIKAMGLKVITGNFTSETDYVRHDPVKVVSRIMTLLEG